MRVNRGFSPYICPSANSSSDAESGGKQWSAKLADDRYLLAHAIDCSTFFPKRTSSRGPATRFSMILMAMIPKLDNMSMSLGCCKFVRHYSRYLSWNLIEATVPVATSRNTRVYVASNSAPKSLNCNPCSVSIHTILNFATQRCVRMSMSEYLRIVCF